MPEIPNHSQIEAGDEVKMPAEKAVGDKKTEAQETLSVSLLARAFNLTKEQQDVLSKIYKDCGIANSKDRADFEKELVSIRTGGVTGGVFKGNKAKVMREQFWLAADRISKEIFKQEDWPLQRVDSQQDEKFLSSSKRVEFVVHPLYSLMKGNQSAPKDGWNADDWRESKGNLDTYLKMKLVPVAQRASKEIELHPDVIPMAYIYLMHVVHELEAMEKPPAPDTARIFVMPRRSLLSPERQAAMNVLLKKFGNNGNVRVLDSQDDGSGALSEQTLETLRATVPFEMPLSFHGGYIGGCLDDCVQSVAKMGRKDLAIHLDASTTMAGTSATENYRTYVPLKSSLKLPPSPIQSLEDIRQWIHQNDAVNQEFRTLSLPAYREELKKEEKFKDVKVTKLPEGKRSVA